MSPGALMDRVYDALKLEILSGVRSSGERLDPVRLAADFSTSATPLRDALHRLMGERLVVTRPHIGFLVPTWNEPGLRDLYRWNLDLVRLVLAPLRTRGDVYFVGMETTGDGPARTAALFARIGLASPNIEHRAAINSANDRLGPARQVESSIFDDHSNELLGLEEALASGKRADIQHRLMRYHRRRILAVPAIVARLRPPA